MKKIIILICTVSILVSLFGCGHSKNDVADVPQDANRVFTIEELGHTIVKAGDFWENWWSLTGPFDFENIDYNELLAGSPRLLPSSGFNSLADIREYLSQYYTKNWLDEAMDDEFFVFTELFDMVYIQVNRAGFPRADWSTATHELIYQEGNRAIVRTTVLSGNFHKNSGKPNDCRPTSILSRTLL